MLAPGQWIDRYELVGPIGDGGMAHVWAARDWGVAPPNLANPAHLSRLASGASADAASLGNASTLPDDANAANTGRLVALKIIHSRFAENAAFRAMFLDEARIVSAISHPNVARVRDLGASGSLLYLVMEYIDGESLFSLIAPAKTAPLRVALRIAADACAGLDIVHRLVDARGQPLNVVHRDISPQNLLLTMRGEVKIIDFGIAHARDRAAATTEVGQVKGKLRYMSPEQARREPLGPSSDVFAIGAVLFRMLAGHAPYAAANEIQTMQALLAGEARKVALPPDLPPAVVAMIDRAISPQVATRYPTAQDLRIALESLLATLPRAPDIAGWVHANLTTEGSMMRARIAQSGPPAFDDAGPTVRPPGRRDAPQAPDLGPPGWAPRGPPPGYAPAGAPAQGYALSGNAQARLAAAAAPGAPGSADGATGGGERARSFMDVGALAAQARVPPPPPAPDRPVEGRFGGRPGYAAPAAVGGGALGAPDPALAARYVRMAIAAIVGVVVIAAVMLLLPRIVRDRAIATAHDAGFVMTVEHVGVGFSGFTFRGVTLTATAAPGLTLSVQQLVVDGIRAQHVRVVGLEAKLAGSLADFTVPLAMLLDENRARFAGTPAAPRHVSLTGGHVLWQGVSGEGSRLEANGIGAEIDSRGAGAEEVHGITGPIEAQTSSLHLGPWATTFDTAPASSRVRLILDPPVPDGPGVLLVWGGAAPPAMTVRVPRSAFANLGLKPDELGLPADGATQLEAQVDGTFPLTDRAEVKGAITLWGARAKDSPTSMPAIDIRTDLVLSGTRDKPFNLDRTTLTIGPFVAGVTGTVAVQDLSVRVDALFKTVPITCDRIAKAGAAKAGAGSPAAAAVQAFAQATGAFRVTGSVNASGVVKYDSASPADASVTWLAKETCGVSIFGM